ncbi:MAG: efflux RND transporter permease subunit [Candidatus Saccharibacteria bacterium]
MADTPHQPTTITKRPVPIEPKDKLLPRITTFFFSKPAFTAFLWLTLFVFGILSYTTLLRREGFPAVDIPVAIITGTYATSDPSDVDTQVAKPISDIARHLPNVKTVQTQSAGSFFSVAVQYKDGVDAQRATATLREQVAKFGLLPAKASVNYSVPYFGATGGDTKPIDIAISFYSKDPHTSTTDLLKMANAAAQALNNQHVTGVKLFSVKDPFKSLIGPDGQRAIIQQNFDRFSYRDTRGIENVNSVIIAVAGTPKNDVIALDAAVRQALNSVRQDPQFSGYGAQVSASFAPAIKDNIAELQRVLLEGLFIVLIVGSLIITIRASLITVLSMTTVIALTLGVLYSIGYTLNVITLFALILGLSLIVDDTIIMVEAIDAARRRQSDPTTIVKTAVRKVSRAMLAATVTASLSFAPFLFVGGVLGSFIRAIPITIITSLLISLFVALIFIPFFARFTLLTRRQLRGRQHNVVASRLESTIARGIARPMLWARYSRPRLWSLGLLAVLVGLGFILSAVILSKQVVFNIFPETKDTNTLTVTLNYPNGTTIGQAQAIAGKADAVTARVLGTNLIQSSYYGQANAQTASAQMDIISYTKRDVKAPQLVAQLQHTFDNNFSGAKASVAQVSTGPPAAAFTVQVYANNRPAALKTANAIADYISTAQLTRPSGKLAHFTHVNPPNADIYTSANGKPIVTVTAGFDGNDTTTLVNLGQTAVKHKFDSVKLRSYGLPANAVSFDIGQESENQDSFKTLALAFPVLLFVIYLVLALEFRSLLQPLLIFMAIPFSLFGVVAGLYITDNPISFFALLGFFALIGLSIKNTILLTDFANQARRSGAGAIDAAVAALEERFRPLIATSLMAVLSLVPLALTSPFWEGLAVVLIFGLLSSTFLVLTVFPYLYLGVELLRRNISPRAFIRWLGPTILLVLLAAKIVGTPLALTVLLFCILVASARKPLKARRARN